MGQPDIVVIHDYHAPHERGNYTITAENTLNCDEKYHITLLDVHCVSDECAIDSARDRKVTKLHETAEILKQLPAGHNVDVVPITIGTRIPLVPADMNSLQVQLGISQEQTHKLYKDIWVQCILPTPDTRNILQGTIQR